MKQLRAMSTSAFVLAAVLLADTALASCSGDQVNNLHCNPFGPLPSKAVSVVALVFWLVLCVIFSSYQAWYFFRRWDCICLVAGCWGMALGLILRVVYHNSPSVGLYSVLGIFEIVVPYAFSLAAYFLFANFVEYLNAEHVLSRYGRTQVSPARVVKMFAIAEFATFLIQTIGGSLYSPSNANLMNVGSKIYLVGVLLQIGVWAVFMSLNSIFLIRCLKDPTRRRYKGWKWLYTFLQIQNLFILMRHIFRAAIWGGGYPGYINAKDGPKFAFNYLGLWCGLVLYVLIWPGRRLWAPRPPDEDPVAERIIVVQPAPRQENQGEAAQDHVHTPPPRPLSSENLYDRPAPEYPGSPTSSRPPPFPFEKRRPVDDKKDAENEYPPAYRTSKASSAKRVKDAYLVQNRPRGSSEEAPRSPDSAVGRDRAWMMFTRPWYGDDSGRGGEGRV